MLNIYPTSVQQMASFLQKKNEKEIQIFPNQKKQSKHEIQNDWIRLDRIIRSRRVTSPKYKFKKKLLFLSQITHYALFWMKNGDAVQCTLKLKQKQSEEEENHQFGDRSPFVRTLHYNWKRKLNRTDFVCTYLVVNSQLEIRPTQHNEIARM